MANRESMAATSPVYQSERTGMKRPLTADELFDMGDIGPCELVRGEVIQMSPTGFQHGKLTATLSRVLVDFVTAHNLGVVCGAETGVILARDPDTVRAPDAMFISRDRMPPQEWDRYLSVAPDLAVEVISPDDRWSDVEEKVEEYLQAGVRLIWIINPKTQTVSVYRSRSDVRLLSRNEELTGDDVLPGFAIPVARLFE